MKILLTGAGGFIGQRVAHRLGQAGIEVIRIVRPGDQSDNSERQPTLQVDLEEPGAILRAIKGQPNPHVQPNKLIHFAAVIPSSFSGPGATAAAEANKRIDKNVFSSCRELEIGAVYASSSSVYGLGTGKLTNELAPCLPLGPYAEAKLLAEELGEQTLCREGLPFTVLRINAPYGPQQRAKTVMNLFIERALNGLPLLYHGTGSRQQDFTYVDDVANAVLQAVIKERSGVYNISTGCPISMKRLAELVVRCVPGCMSIVLPSGESDSQEGATALYDIEKAAVDLNWRPQTPLESGIRTWISDRLK